MTSVCQPIVFAIGKIGYNAEIQIQEDIYCNCFLLKTRTPLLETLLEAESHYWFSEGSALGLAEMFIDRCRIRKVKGLE